MYVDYEEDSNEAIDGGQSVKTTLNIRVTRLNAGKSVYFFPKLNFIQCGNNMSLPRVDDYRRIQVEQLIPNERSGHHCNKMEATNNHPTFEKVYLVPNFNSPQYGNDTSFPMCKDNVDGLKVHRVDMMEHQILRPTKRVYLTPNLGPILYKQSTYFFHCV